MSKSKKVTRYSISMSKTAKSVIGEIKKLGANTAEEPTKEGDEKPPQKASTAVQSDVMEYLAAIANLKTLTGKALVECQLLRWLHLGYDEKITIHKLRNIKYRSYDHKPTEKIDEKTGEKVEIPATMEAKNTKASMASIEVVFALYTDEIEAHNKKIEKSQKKS